jgi:hypothetical protein
MLDMIDIIVIDIFENNLPVNYRENSPKSSESRLAVFPDRMNGFRIHYYISVACWILIRFQYSKYTKILLTSNHSE